MTLTTELVSLFELNKNRNKWDSWLDDEATWKFIKKVASDPSFMDIMDFELAADFLPILFNDFEFPSKKSIKISEANSFVQLLKENMLINISNYWIVLPLLNAELTQSIMINDDISILAGEREKKLQELTRIIGIEIDEAVSRFVHTEKSRSPNFFDDPLLVIKITHQHRIIHQNAVDIVYYAVNFINVLYWGYVTPVHKGKGYKRLLKGRREHVNQHVMIQNVKNSKWGHSPINFEYDCNFNLDWLNEKKYGKMLSDLMNLISFKYEKTGLSDRFLRGIRFFVRGINVKKGNRFFDGESDVILLLNIASECILIKSQEEGNKSRKIKGRLSKLGDIEELGIEARRKIIERMSNLRGAYVHEGLSNNFSSFLGDEEKTTELEAYKKIVARFLCGAFEMTEKCRKQAALSGKDIEEIWFESFQN